MLTSIEKVPVIRNFQTKQNFGYLWVKYVTGFNLNVHCAKSLIGEYSVKVDNETNKTENIILDEFQAKYYYLCGVVEPYIWKDNLHLAFKYAEGKNIFFENNGTKIIIENAEKIPIIQQESYSLHTKGKFKSYNTCRNWQFAYQTFFNL